MRKVSLPPGILSVWPALLYLSLARSPCPLTEPKSYSYLYNGTCFSAVFSSSLPKTGNAEDLLQMLDQHCRSLDPSARLANLLDGKELQLPPPDYWMLKKNRLSFFVGEQIDPRQGKEPSNKEGEDQADLIRNLVNSSSQYLKIHVEVISTSVSGGAFICPVIIAKRDEPKYTMKFTKCKSKPTWDMFFCKSPYAASTSSKVVGLQKSPAANTPSGKVCTYDKERGKCFLRSAAPETNSIGRDALVRCRCSTCTIGKWTKWGPWSTTCGQAERFRMKPKDGEAVSHCIDDQTLCCFEMERKNLLGCDAINQQMQIITDCLNGGIPIDMGEGNVVCSCRKNFTGTLCEKKRVKRTVRALPSERTKRFYSSADKSRCLTSPCDCRPCLHGGTCNDLGNGRYECSCHVMFYGPLCEHTRSKPCEQVHCKNGGYCVSDREKFTCVCPPGYMGVFCEREAKPCKNPHICRNGGTCQSDGIHEICRCPTAFIGRTCGIHLLTQECNAATCIHGECVVRQGRPACRCKKGFEGMYCGAQADECASNPCLNGGRCENIVGGFRCICDEKYVGELCEEKVSPCASNPCVKGLCNRVGDAYLCNCYPGYEGTNCQREINECLSEPCQNGGECEDLVNSYKCYCQRGFSGPTCAYSEVKKEKRTPWDTDYAVPLTILVLLLTLAVLGLIFYTYRNHVYTMKKEATPDSQPDKTEDIELSGRPSSRRGTLQKVAEFMAALGWGKSESHRTESKDASEKQKAKPAGEQTPQKKQLDQQKKEAISPKRKIGSSSPSSGRKTPSSSISKGSSRGKSKSTPQKPPSSRSPERRKGSSKSLSSGRLWKSSSRSKPPKSRKHKHRQRPSPLFVKMMKTPDQTPLQRTSVTVEDKAPHRKEKEVEQKLRKEEMERSKEREQASDSEQQRSSQSRSSKSEDPRRGSKRWWQFNL